MHTITTRVDDQQYQQLLQMADLLDVSLSEAIRGGIELLWDRIGETATKLAEARAQLAPDGAEEE